MESKAELAHSSAASKGPTVLRRGIGCDMFRPCRRTLFVGDSVDSMLSYDRARLGSLAATTIDA